MYAQKRSNSIEYNKVRYLRTEESGGGVCRNIISCIARFFSDEGRRTCYKQSQLKYFVRSSYLALFHFFKHFAYNMNHFELYMNQLFMIQKEVSGEAHVLQCLPMSIDVTDYI